MPATNLRILITAGSTREPIDPVRFIGNRSSGRMGAALSTAAQAAGHSTTLIVGPVSAMLPAVRRIDVETAREMHAAVIAELPNHDLLIMAAAVADYRPITTSTEKLARSGRLVIECEPTEDIVAAAVRCKRLGQRVIGFSLEQPGQEWRAQEKLFAKGLDLMVFNPITTMESEMIEAVLIYPDGRRIELAQMGKSEFAERLITAACELVR